MTLLSTAWWPDTTPEGGDQVRHCTLAVAEIPHDGAHLVQLERARLRQHQEASHQAIAEVARTPEDRALVTRAMEQLRADGHEA